MDRHTSLQAELTRIEREAEAKSYAIMNRADDLMLAHRLCALLNTGVTRADPLRPSVVYEGDALACRVKIIAGEAGAEILQLADRHSVGWCSERCSGSGHDVRFDGFDVVEVMVTNAQFLAYMESVEAAA